MVLLLMASPVIIFLSILVKPKAGTNAITFWFYHRRSKNKVINFVSFFRSAELDLRGFQIWSQNWNRMAFDPLFGHKTVENCQNTGFWQFSIVLWPKRGSNVIRFQFWDQIWNPLIMASSTDRKMKRNWKLCFWPPMVKPKFWRIWARLWLDQNG